MESTPRVVVGVTGSPASRWALAWAVGTARRYAMRLTVVAAYGPPATGGQFGGVAVGSGREEAEAAVDAAFRDVCGGLPDVEVVEVTCVRAHAGRALTSAAGAGDLLVIGSGGRWRGATRRYCARHTRCPMVIVPCPDAGDLLGSPIRTVRRITRNVRHD